ncbi:MAG: restriction endonuclease subunit S [Imperialibacter sp.]
MKREILTINDVCKFIGGSQPPKDTFISEPREGYIRLIQTRDYKTDSFKTYIPRTLARRFCSENDIMIGRYGPPIFQICRGLTGAYNVALLKASPKGNIVNDYLFYYLKQNSVFEYVEKLSSRTGGQTGVDLECLKKYPITLPDLIEQKKVTSILSSLDSKIELNNRINQELEAMAKLIYDYWFVQFDFPMSKEQAAALGKPELTGKPYKTSGGPLVYNEVLKKGIPEGWDVKPIGKILTTALGGTPSTQIKKYWSNGNIPWLNSGEIADFPIIGSELRITQEAVDNSAAKVMPKGTVVISITRHLRPSILAIDACANQSVVGICESNELKHSYIYPFLKNDIPRLMSLRTGAQQPHINKETIDDSNIILPTNAILNSYYKIVDPFYNQIMNNAFQNQHLTSLRDWLLPMLMNGQVKVGKRVTYEQGEAELRMVAEPEVRYGNKTIGNA